MYPEQLGPLRPVAASPSVCSEYVGGNLTLSQAVPSISFEKSDRKNSQRKLDSSKRSYTSGFQELRIESRIST